MKQIKVGFLPLYIQLYDDNMTPDYRAPMEQYMNTVIQMLKDQGLQVIPAEAVCRIAPEFEAAVAKFNAEDVDAVITMHLAYSPSLESIDALMKLEAPIIVFDSTADYEIVSYQNSENRIGPNHGIHGVQDMCNLLKRNEKAYHICAGHALHSNVIAELCGMCRAAAARKAYRNMKIGSVGGSFHGMGDFLISDERYKKEIGAQVSYMTPEIAEKYLAKVTEQDVTEEIASDAMKYNVSITSESDYRAATKTGLAIRKWMEENHFGALTVNFLTFDQSGLPKMPFPECCKTLERDLGYAGEGDALTAGLVGALHHVYSDVTFTEMFCPDWERNVILMSHMSESNPALAQWKPYITSLPFNYNSSGDTVGMYSCARPGNCVIVNLAPMRDSFALILCPGKMLDIGIEGNVYTYATQGWFKPAMDLPRFLKEYSMAGGTHHSALVYDISVDELKTFGQMMHFDVIVIA